MFRIVSLFVFFYGFCGTAAQALEIPSFGFGEQIHLPKDAQETIPHKTNGAAYSNKKKSLVANAILRAFACNLDTGCSYSPIGNPFSGVFPTKKEAHILFSFPSKVSEKGFPLTYDTVNTCIKHKTFSIRRLYGEDNEISGSYEAKLTYEGKVAIIRFCLGKYVSSMKKLSKEEAQFIKGSAVAAFSGGTFKYKTEIFPVYFKGIGRMFYGGQSRGYPRTGKQWNVYRVSDKQSIISNNEVWFCFYKDSSDISDIINLAHRIYLGKQDLRDELDQPFTEDFLRVRFMLVLFKYGQFSEAQIEAFYTYMTTSNDGRYALSEPARFMFLRELLSTEKLNTHLLKKICFSDSGMGSFEDPLQIYQLCLELIDSTDVREKIPEFYVRVYEKYFTTRLNEKSKYESRRMFAAVNFIVEAWEIDAMSKRAYWFGELKKCFEHARLNKQRLSKFITALAVSEPSAPLHGLILKQLIAEKRSRHLFQQAYLRDKLRFSQMNPMRLMDVICNEYAYHLMPGVACFIDALLSSAYMYAIVYGANL